MSLDELLAPYEDVAKFHGHWCPGLAIGVKAAEFAISEIGTNGDDEQVVCVAETDMCGVDAVMYMTGCTLGKGNLKILDLGKVAFSFFRRSDGASVRLVLKNGLKKRMTREEYLKFILSSRPEELFDKKIPCRPAPPKAMIDNSLACGICGEGVMETKTRNYGGRALCLGCFDKILEENHQGK